MTIEELKQAQENEIPICREWGGMKLEGRIDSFVEYGQVVVKWKTMENKAMRFTEYISVIPCELFVEEINDNIKIDSNEQT